MSCRMSDCKSQRANLKFEICDLNSSRSEDEAYCLRSGGLVPWIVASERSRRQLAWGMDIHYCQKLIRIKNSRNCTSSLPLEGPHDQQSRLHPFRASRRCGKKSRVCGPAAPGFSLFLRDHHARHDGGQHRACRQLLAFVSKVPVARVGGLCRHQPLDSVSVAIGLFWRSCGSPRLPQSHSGSADCVHGRLDRLGGLVLHGHDSSVACVGSAHFPWDCRSFVDSSRTTHHP
jgi:hypothetical protein